MAMRLLNKSEIAKAQNLDKSREVAEGLKLSRRVDSLRELAAYEEAALAKFRDESLAVITKEITDLNEKKENLASEVQSLREEKEKGLGDLEEKQADINAFENLLREREKALEATEKELQEKLKEAALNIRNSEDELQRAQTHKEEATKLLFEASEDREEARKTLSASEHVREKTLREREAMEDALALRESDVLKKEVALISKEEENGKLYKELSKQRIQLEDQRKTLERAMARLKK
jgi:chromosome segregation ATPase